MKKILFIAGLLCAYYSSIAQQLKGTVFSKNTGEAISGVNFRLKQSGLSFQSGAEGGFSFTLYKPDTLIVSHVGYRVQRLAVHPAMAAPLQIVLETSEAMLQEVAVSTGFYQVPKERATGSYTYIDNELLNRSVGGNILQRLEGVASGVQFTQANSTDPAKIRVRGVSTIESNETPLIVVDNFPYEGNLGQINPNDILSVTVLKDAAAASIWGARAGNGVIVITTKQGGYNQKNKISVNSNVTIGEKPDLLYNQNRLPSETVMAIEKEKYEQGSYYIPDASQTPFPEYVELLIKKDNGEISEADFRAQENLMKNTEVRKEALKYLYQPSVYQQYSLNVSGGGQAYRYYVSAGYDKNRSEIIGNQNNRLNLSMNNTLQPIKNLELTAGIWYAQSGNETNGLTLDDLSALNTSFIGISPYIRLADAQGSPLPIVKDYRLVYTGQAESNGLLNWDYRPLDEVRLADNSGKSGQLRLNGGLQYHFLDAFNVNTTYQYIKSNSQTTRYFDPESYYVRNLVNRFTQDNGSLVIPAGGILQGNDPTETVSHSGRMQLNFHKAWNPDHQVSALGGAEIRSQVQNTFPGYLLYDYDKDLLTGTNFYNYPQVYKTRPSGVSTYIPAPSYTRNRYTDRYLSYFGNASYLYRERYILSGSARWDGSNLFGVKTNQKGTPLWSIGGSWEASKEGFYHLAFLPYLRVRMTYGSSGNVNKSLSTYPTVRYNTQTSTGLQYANLLSAGNPSLRWERVNTLNGGIDFATKDHRISGSMDYYVKKANDLIGEDYLAPSTGIITGGTAINTNLINYANLQTHGLDVQLSSLNTQGRIKWQTTALLNYVKNKITNYNSNETLDIFNYLRTPAAPRVGKSRDVLYAQPWHGLDHDTGLPIIYMDGLKSDDYLAYWNSFSPDNLVNAGVTIPPFYGSLRNDIHFENFSLSVLITWKSGYKFRRNSMIPGREYAGDYHMDYYKRWQKPGDELYTDVPGGNGTDSQPGDYAYRYSEALITSGDLIRLQDINFSYTFSSVQHHGSPFQSLRLFAYARNLGILWKRNKNGIDPDYLTGYPVPKIYSFGLQADF